MIKLNSRTNHMNNFYDRYVGVALERFFSENLPLKDLQTYWPTDQKLSHESKLSSFSYCRGSNKNVGLQYSSTQILCGLFLSGAASYFMRECRNETRKQVFLFKKISALFLKCSKLLMWISELEKLSFAKWSEDY